LESAGHLCPRCGTGLVVAAADPRSNSVSGREARLCPKCGHTVTAEEADDDLLIGNLAGFAELKNLGGLGELGDLASPELDAPPLLDLLPEADLAAPAAAYHASPRGAAAPGTGTAGLDLFLGPLPGAASSPLAPLELDLNDPGAADVGIGIGAGIGALGPTDAPADLDVGGGDPMDIGAMFATLLPTGSKGNTDPASAPVASPFAGGADSLPAPAATGPVGAGLLPDLGLVTPPAGMPAAGISGWSLTLTPPPVAPESAARPEPETYRAPPLPSPAGAPARPPAAGTGGPSPLPSGMPRLEPPRRRGETLVAAVDAPRRNKIPLIGAGAGLVIAAGVLALVLGRGRGDQDPSAALAPFVADLQRDHYPTYQKAADAIMASEAAAKSPGKRARAAELLLLASLGHGVEKSKINRANELLTDVTPAGTEPGPQVARARALLAVARSHGSEAESLLGAQAGEPDGVLIKSLRRLRERRPAEAMAGLRSFVGSAPDRLLGQYLLARALEDTQKRDEARQIYGKVLAANPKHAGALVGVARLTASTPAERHAAALALVKQIDGAASPSELGEAQTLLGEALLALGQTAPALDVLNSAALSTPSDPAAWAGLTEAMLAEGRAADAVARLRSVDPIVLTTPQGRLAMGAALVSSGQIAEGTAQIEAAATQLPGNPRAVTWQAVAAESKRPSDDATAVRRFREALAIDPRFLPASLRLAALLQRQGKPDQALALIKEAETAGAPKEALSVAWGQALIEAKNPSEAEVVLRKAVERSPALVAARTALASALEASGKSADAEAELSRAIVDLPKASGLRERLAGLYAKHGKKEDALATLDKQRTVGPLSTALRVQIAKLALDLRQPERAIKELQSVVVEDPATPEALFTLGRAREANGDSSGALAEYKRALAFETSSDLHLAYGRVLAQGGRDDEALSEFGAAGEIASARLERARIRLRRNETQEALKEAEAAARLAPQEGRAFFLAGLCLDLMGRADDAATAWKHALESTPDLAEAHYRLGRYEMDKGRQASALAHFRSAAAKPLNKVAWEADLFFQLGFAEAAGGSRGGAITALRHYLDLSATDAPARPEAERQLARLTRR
jgi:tetratricopeptide (TPR) repeat protein